MRSGQDPADRVESAATLPRLPMQTTARSHCISFRGGKFANWMSRVTGYDGVVWNIPGHHRSGTDNGALTNRYALKDDGIKANPDLVLYLDGSTVHAVPLFGAPRPIAYIIFTLRPVQAVRVMINDGNCPRS